MQVRQLRLAYLGHALNQKLVPINVALFVEEIDALGLERDDVA